MAATSAFGKKFNITQQIIRNNIIVPPKHC